MATFGHAGDGNLHVNVLTDENHREPPVAARIDAALGDVFRAALDLGGTLSGEHGIGIAKARTWPGSSRPRSSTGRSASSGSGIPQDLLNPGKIFAGSSAALTPARLLHLDAVFFLQAVDLRLALRT